MKYLIVFFSIFISDAIWTFYISAVSKNKAVIAGLFSALTILFGMLATIVIVAEPKYLIPAVLGGFFGTYFTMKFLNSKSWRRYD